MKRRSWGEDWSEGGREGGRERGREEISGMKGHDTGTGCGLGFLHARTGGEGE